MPDSLGRVIKRLRKEKRLSQEAMAERSQLSRPALAAIESGAASPNIATLRRLAETVGRKCSELLREVELADEAAVA